jgi:Pyruvate/2-oxoacid:ferredoxin oxidoreductase gamma subunit
VEPWWDRKAPSFEAEKILALMGAGEGGTPRYTQAFPSHIASSDISLKLAGAGGDGAQTAALLLAQAAISEGFDATHIPSYGPESRGGTSYADVHIAETEVLDPAAPNPDILVAFNAPSLAKFAPAVKEGGTIIYDSTVIAEVRNMPPNRRLVGVPFTGIALGLERPMVKNVVALGALAGATGILPPERFVDTIRMVLKDKPKLLPLNERAFAEGIRHASPVGV